ncbi:MAG: DUF5658 family protein [Planctomycetaceae bacterium]
MADAEGYLFVDGQYVKRPYQFVRSGETIEVNGIALDGPGLSIGRERRRHSEDSFQHSGPARRSWKRIADSLSNGELVVFVTDRPLITVQRIDIPEVASALMSLESHETLPSCLVDELTEEQWRSWKESFVPVEDFRLRVEAEVARRDALEAQNNSSILAVHRLNTWSYPLSIVGMLAVVLAMGHLLSHRPIEEPGPAGARTSSQVTVVVGRSLLLVAFLSLLDLVWTILTAQAGVIREVNPVARNLISDPMQLMMLKVGATTLAITLLYTLRRHAIAQSASWWSCLVCTLLTARWLTFTSMFIS